MSITAIIGNVGTGKSTLLRHLSNHNDVQVIPADEFFKVNPFFLLSKAAPERWDFTNDLWFLVRRAEMLRQSLKDPKKQHVVIDSGVLMSYVYAYTHYSSGWLTADEWKFFTELFDQHTQGIRKPDTAIVLGASFEAMRQRIQSRNREFEVSGYFDYLQSIEAGIDAVVEKLEKEHIKVKKIDTTSLRPAQVADQVVSEMFIR